ncbi:uncharacterized protein MELLADRAFT_113287 [Melampsora larici-populina 98AG31]|uniref:Uncharacterized protein n=1 Tax=Melampsora larici-populina (strain 98AG31 / pathotype 3-4-7) TaxID=747676 RepID=F4S9D1_MELLP|nr:uncharacterized protein MELLADRAFT_113287 [Melampsora larici-populina 98AG31]EGF98750.1 hypothetical protein MELLADRAFT_113287 [Melampsora larici-populina 98AG31]
MASTLKSNPLLFKLHQLLLPLLDFKSTHTERISCDIWAVTLGLRRGCLIDHCQFSETSSRLLSSKLKEVGELFSNLTIIFEIHSQSTFICSRSVLHCDARLNLKFITLSSNQIRLQEEPPEGFSDSISHIQNHSITNAFLLLNGFGSNPVTIAGWLIGYPFLYVTPKRADWVWQDAHLKVINFTLMGSQSKELDHQLMAFSIPSEIEAQLDFEAILITLQDKINQQIQSNGSDLSIWNHVTYSTKKLSNMETTTILECNVNFENYA